MINIYKFDFHTFHNKQIFLYSFLGYFYSKSKIHKIIKKYDKYVTKLISIEKIKNKIDIYEIEMEIKDENNISNKNLNNNFHRIFLNF